MANPSLVNVPGAAWKKVAAGVQNGYINIQGPPQEKPKVFFAFLDAGEAAPTIEPPLAASGGIPLVGRSLPINSTVLLDAYLFPVINDIDVVVAAT